MDFEQIALDNISRPDISQLAPLDAAPEVGQVLAFFSRNSIRTGVVTKVGRKNAQVLYTTEGALTTSAHIHQHAISRNPEADAKAAGSQAGETWDWYKGMADGTYPWNYEYDRAEYADRLAKAGTRDEFVQAATADARERSERSKAHGIKVGPLGFVHFTTKSVAIDKLWKVTA